MTAEQLQHARAAAWCQQGNPLLTADDATAWLRETGIALFLPRTAQIAAPAPSFVEATAGESNATPKPAAIASAISLLHRLTVSGDAAALNLLGMPGDQPDFLVTEETLPFLYALRGDREWKRGPRGKSSPLVVEVWKLLDRDGALTADELKDKLGRHLTESAALRALTDLWTNLRIEPIYSAGNSGGEGTHWQLLEANHEEAMTAGAAMSQGMALSGLVSLYLQSAVAATGDEIEAFLSPLASRSRVRDAVRGLMATRQLGVRNLGAHEHFFVEGSLPEFEEISPVSNVSEKRSEAAQSATPLADLLPEVPAPADIVMGGFRIEALSESETEKERSVGDGRKRFVAGRESAGGDRKSYGGRPGGERKTFGGERKTFGGERKTFGGARKPFGDRGAPGGERKSFSSSPREAGSGDAPPKPFFAREPWKEDRRPGGASSSSEGGPSSDRRPYTPGSDRKPFTRPAAGGDRPYTPREDRPAASGDRKPFTRPSTGGDQPYTPREGGRPTFGDRKPFTPRGDRPYTPREGGRPSPGGDRKPFAPRGDRPFTPREDRPASKGSDRPYTLGGERKTFTRPAAGGERPYTPREGRPSFNSSGGSDRKPFSRPGGDRPYPPREGRPSFNGSGGSDRKPFSRPGGGRPYTPRPDADGGMRPPRKPFAPREGGRPAGGSDRKPFSPRGADGPSRKPFSGGGDGERRPYTPRAEGASSRPYTPRAEGGAPESGAGPKPGKRPRTSPFTSSGKPRAGVGKPAGRPGPRAARPGAGPRASKPGAGSSQGKRPGKPGGKSGPRRDG